RSFFFSLHTPPTELYPLSLHDALPISNLSKNPKRVDTSLGMSTGCSLAMNASSLRHHQTVWGSPSDNRYLPKPPTAHASVVPRGDRKSTRLNSSHRTISYAVFCLKKKK